MILIYLVVFVLALCALAAIFGKNLEISNLKKQVTDLRNVFDFYPVNPQEIVKARLREVALGWRDAKLALSDAHRMGPGECKSEYQKFRQEVERCTKLVEQYEETFSSLYDHAKRVFGEALPLQEKQIELYLPKEKAA